MQATVAATAGEQKKIVGLISVGHFYSHFSSLILPPLFPLMKAEFGVSYIALGGIITTYSVASSAGQIPFGFLVDRFGGRPVLICGIALLGVAYAMIGFTADFWQILLLAALAGLGNSVFHPADYAILSARIRDGVLGRAMSIHSFSGYIGWAAAPPAMLGLAAITDWRIAVTVAGLLGIAIAVLMLWRGQDLADRAVSPHEKQNRSDEPSSWKQGLLVMRSLPMVMMSLFFLLTAITIGGVASFSVVALDQLYATGETVAGHALTTFMIAMAFGVLLGGVAADWSKKHNLVASVALGLCAVAVMAVGAEGIHWAAMFAAMAAGGLFMGVTSPSRDILVRRAAPAGAIGVAFGFSSTGMGIGNGLGPLIAGWIMDAGRPGLMFVVMGAVSAAAIFTVLLTHPGGKIPSK